MTTTAERQTPLRSIQGESQDDAERTTVWATEGDVDAWVDSHSEGAVECRARMRHDFPTPRHGEATFTDIDADGLYVARYQCRRCHLAVRVEKWEAVRRGKQLRWYRVSRNVYYQRGADGETYQAEVGTRIRPRMVEESQMTAAMSGQSLGALRKAITQRRKADD